MLATFPEEPFYRLKAHDGEKFFQYRARPLVLLGADAPWCPEHLHPAWRATAEMLLSPDYRRALASATGCSLDGARMEASVWRWGADAQLGPHLDMSTKLVTQVVYFAVGWNPDWGGCLRILGSADSEDTVAELPPALGSSSLLVRSDKSWHCVTPVRATAPANRLSLIITWLAPGASSVAWDVGADGTVMAPGGTGVEDPATAAGGPRVPAEPTMRRLADLPGILEAGDARDASAARERDRAAELEAGYEAFRDVAGERSAELRAMRREREAAASELARLRERAHTLDLVEAGGWWRLRGRLEPLLRLAGAVKRRF